MTDAKTYDNLKEEAQTRLDAHLAEKFVKNPESFIKNFYQLMMANIPLSSKSTEVDLQAAFDSALRVERNKMAPHIDELAPLASKDWPSDHARIHNLLGRIGGVIIADPTTRDHYSYKTISPDGHVYDKDSMTVDKDGKIHENPTSPAQDAQMERFTIAFDKLGNASYEKFPSMEPPPPKAIFVPRVNSVDPKQQALENAKELYIKNMINTSIDPDVYTIYSDNPEINAVIKAFEKATGADLEQRGLPAAYPVLEFADKLKDLVKADSKRSSINHQNLDSIAREAFKSSVNEAIVPLDGSKFPVTHWDSDEFNKQIKNLNKPIGKNKLDETDVVKR